jgi:hypothetical protein
LNDVGVVESGEGFGFALEPHPSLTRSHLGRQDLQCHLAAELRVLSDIDFTLYS